MNPVSERLIFNKNDNAQAKFHFSTDKPFYQPREQISSEIVFIDTEKNPLAGHLSVAITDNTDIEADTLYAITSSLLLSSELRGYIESPGYYLQDHANATLALDHLMMTHGWRRYDIPEVIKGNYTRPAIEFETMLEISGTVKSVLLGRPVANGEVVYFSTDGSVGLTETNAAGLFRFDIHYPDSTGFFIQARNRKGGEYVELFLNPEKFPKLKYAPVSASLLPVAMNQEVSSVVTVSDFIKKAEQRSLYDEDMRAIHLNEVVVTAKRIEKKDEARLRYWMNESSDHTIYRERIEQRAAIRVLDIFQGIPGVRINYDSETITIRDAMSFRDSGLPLVIIDGIPIDWEPGFSPLEMVSVQDIETVDIFKGPSAAIFGLRGGNGVISITTRRGVPSDNSDMYRFNYASINPAGFQKPVEFYAPKYDTPESKNLSIPDFRTTLYWKPDLIVSDDGKASFDFYASDFPTTYSVVFEGISNDGKIIRQVETIVIK